MRGDLSAGWSGWAHFRADPIKAQARLRHKPLPASSPRGHRSVTDVVVTLKARVAELEAELGRTEERSRGHRADFERERERAEHMVTIQDRLIAELENLRSLLEAAQQSARPVTPRTWREMSWPERWRWLRAPGLRP